MKQSTLLQAAARAARGLTDAPSQLSDDEIYRKAVMEATGDEGGNDTTSDKGLFGNRQLEFVQDVYYMPKELTGDESQPVGLLTQSDLNNYVYFRKNDRLTFKYKEGQSGACKYSARKNGETEYSCKFDWTDQLIQELIDEGACKLI